MFRFPSLQPKAVILASPIAHVEGNGIFFCYYKPSVVPRFCLQ